MFVPGGKPWFRPKAGGMGIGMPTCWQGWASIGVLVVFCLAGAIAFRGIARGLWIFGSVIGFGGFAYLKTELGGGWNWVRQRR